MQRRRQQIRNAQRAYRNRKDNRIVELEEQVKRLECEKANMLRDFGSVLDLLRGQGIAEISVVTAQCFDDLRRKHPLGMLDYHDCDAQSVISSNAGRETVPSTKAPMADTGHHHRPSTGTGPVSDMEEYQGQWVYDHWLRFWNGGRSGGSILE